MPSLSTTDIEAMRHARRVVIHENRGNAVLSCQGSSPLARLLGALVPVPLSSQTPRPIPIDSTTPLGASPLRGGNTRSRTVQRAHNHPTWNTLTNTVRPGDRIRIQWERDGRALLLVQHRNSRHVSRFAFGKVRRSHITRRIVRPTPIGLLGIAAWAVAANSLTLGLVAGALAVAWLAAGMVVPRKVNGRRGPVQGAVRALLLWGVATSSPVLAVFAVFLLCLGLRSRMRRRQASNERPHARPDLVDDDSTRPLRAVARDHMHAVRTAAGKRCRRRIGRALPGRARRVVDTTTEARPPRNSTHAYRTHVKSTATILDEIEPAWRQRLSVEDLDPADPGASLLERLFGDFDEGLEAITHFARSRPEINRYVDCIHVTVSPDNCDHISAANERAHHAALLTAWTRELEEPPGGHASAAA